MAINASLQFDVLEGRAPTRGQIRNITDQVRDLLRQNPRAESFPYRLPNGGHGIIRIEREGAQGATQDRATPGPSGRRAGARSGPGEVLSGNPSAGIVAQFNRVADGMRAEGRTDSFVLTDPARRFRIRYPAVGDETPRRVAADRSVAQRHRHDRTTGRSGGQTWWQALFNGGNSRGGIGSNQRRMERMERSGTLYSMDDPGDRFWTRLHSRVQRLRPHIVRIAREEGIPPGLFARLIQQESGGRASVTSSAGAIGLTQLMPATARGLGVNPWDPMENLRGGASYLARQYREFGDWNLALGAYNAGPGRIRQYGHRVPPFRETRNYVRTILGPDANRSLFA